jgi:hypothetical protein
MTPKEKKTPEKEAGEEGTPRERIPKDDTVEEARRRSRTVTL